MFTFARIVQQLREAPMANVDYPARLGQRWGSGLPVFRGLEEEIGVVESQAYLDGAPESRKARYILRQLGLIRKTLEHSWLAELTSRHWVLLFTTGSNAPL